VEDIHLHWIGSSRTHIYLPNIAHAWDDALDNFHYTEHLAGFDLRTVSGKREEALRKLLHDIEVNDSGVLNGDIYLAGPREAVEIVERHFLDKGLPKTRVSAAAVK